MADTMLEKVAKAIDEASKVRAFGLYDYSAYPEMEGGLKRHVVRDELTRKSQVVFESNNPSEARHWHDAACRAFIARAALQAIREPDDAFVEQAMGYRNATAVTKAVSGRFTAMIDAILSEGKA